MNKNKRENYIRIHRKTNYLISHAKFGFEGNQKEKSKRK
jgi:hypothetical protein